MSITRGFVVWVSISRTPRVSVVYGGRSWITLLMLVSTCILGMLLAVPLGLIQVTGPKMPALLCKAFCTIIRGTPLLLQLWLIYYGVGFLFPQVPEIRNSMLWPYLREAWPYDVLALTFSFAGYEGDIMRGAFAGVPHGELEAARAYGMGRFTMVRRIWLHRALPAPHGMFRKRKYK